MPTNVRFMLQTIPIPAFTDNYFWVMHNCKEAIVVDPGAAAPVVDFLQENSLHLAGIFVTHWHHDHIGGIEELLQHSTVPVYGPRSSHIPQVTHPLNNGDTFKALETTFNIIAVPGHTLEHIAYYCPSEAALFSGDTLFAGGCGRLFEGTADMMYTSLQKLARLPAETAVYCAHEYTVSNLRFALEVEPDNTALLERLLYCEKLRQDQRCTLPASLAIELLTNPFLRVTQESVITQTLNQGAYSSSPLDIFTCLREWKNHF